MFGKIVTGSTIDSRGFVPCATLEQVDNQDGLILKWKHIDNRTDNDYYAVIVDSNVIAFTQDTQLPLYNLRPDRGVKVDVFPVSGIEKACWLDKSFTLFIAPESGNRVKITIDEASLSTNPDFYSYVLYWDEGLGGAADTELAELVGIENTVYITDELVDGTTYQFRVAYKDFVGNESTPGSTYSETANDFPDPVTAVNSAYTQATRTIAFTAEGYGSETGLVGCAAYCNYIPGQGLQDYICFDKKYRLSLLPLNPTSMPYTTYQLSAEGATGVGTWRFAFRMVDESGLESSYDEQVFVLERQGNDLVLIDDPPDAPTSLEAYPAAAGVIHLDITLANLTNVDEIAVWQDGVEVDQVSVGTFLEDKYEWDSGALTHGQTYSFYATAVNNNTHSLPSNTDTATADDTGPTGVKTLTTELID